MGLKARAWALENFNMAKMISSWDETLQKAISERNYKTLNIVSI